MNYISILLCILLIVLSSGCKSDTVSVGVPKSEKIAFQTIIHDSFEMSNDTNFITTVLRSKQEEDAFVASHLPFIPSFSYYESKLSTVDYQHSMLVCILLGTQSEGASISVTIDSILVQGVTWKVYAHILYPCVWLDEFANPADLVTVPWSNIPVVFNPIPIIRECNGS